MREAVGSTFLFKLMIFFIFFFASFLTIAINYSQAFRVKNQIINYLEQGEGYNADSINKIIVAVNGIGYHRDVTCDINKDGKRPKNGSNQAVGVCVLKQTNGSGTNNQIYYKVTTFVSFDFPIVGRLFTLDVSGETKTITNPNDDWDSAT